MSERACSDSIREQQVQTAERELSAFVSAVTELFGPEQARYAAEAWIEELELTDSPPRFTLGDWRAVTVAASAKLAGHLSLARHHLARARRVG
jgi:hypothetical protein